MSKQRNLVIMPSVLLLLAACNSSQAEATIDTHEFDWVAQSDGSILASSEGEVDTRITRCYPKGPQFDCLAVVAMNSGMILLSREVRDDPSTHNGRDNFETSQVGYSCSIYLESGMQMIGEGVNFYKEAISSEKGRVKQQDIQLRPTFGGAGNSQWPATHVNQFIEENGLIVNNLWFDCGEIAKIIDNGSIASLETNLVSYDGIFESE